jgi:hypothetical protein
MYSGKIVLAQLMKSVPRHEFNQCVRRYQGNARVRGFSWRDQFLAMAFAQLTFRESLRDIETSLRATGSKCYHAGFRGRVSRSTLADANRRRDWRIYADLAQGLIGIARKLYADDRFGVELDETAYAFDSTTIDLCLSLFPWARFRRRKGAVKLHTLLDLRGNIPSFIHISSGNIHDVNALDELVLEPGAFYILDRGYVDFARLYRFTQQMAFFIIRGKRNLDYARQAYRRVDKSTGLRSDQKVILKGPKTSKQYPVALRRITYVDAETGKRFTFLTNNWTVPALSIARLYKCRWQVDVLFRVLKSGCRVEERRFERIGPLLACVSVYLIVAWRTLMPCRLGRACPDLDCEAVFDPSEWKSVWMTVRREPPPATPPRLMDMLKMVAQFGGYVNPIVA